MVKFDNDILFQLEEKHNLFAQVSQNPEIDEEYNPQFAMVIVHVISDLNLIYLGECFRQQFILKKRIEKI